MRYSMDVLTLRNVITGGSATGGDTDVLPLFTARVAWSEF